MLKSDLLLTHASTQTSHLHRLFRFIILSPCSRHNSYDHSGLCHLNVNICHLKALASGLLLMFLLGWQSPQSKAENKYAQMHVCLMDASIACYYCMCFSRLGIQTHRDRWTWRTIFSEHNPHVCGGNCILCHGRYDIQ